MHSFFLHKLELITVLHLICNSYTSISTWFISLKRVLPQTICMIQFVWTTISFQIVTAFTLSYKNLELYEILLAELRLDEYNYKN